MSSSLTPAINDLAYDLVAWLVASCLNGSGGANFVDGENSSSTQTTGTFHAYAAYSDDAPNDLVVVTVASDTEHETFLPLRDAQVRLLVRAGDLIEISGRVRAEAAAKTIAEFMRDTKMESRGLVALPSGRVVMIFNQIKTSNGGLDGSGRSQVLLEARVQYRDQITQTS